LTVSVDLAIVRLIHVRSEEIVNERAVLPELPDIDDVRPVDETDQVVFDEIREVLNRHGALQRFGLTLLHQHFGMAEDETLLERIDRDNRTLTLRPATINESSNGVETSWRLDDPTGQQRCETVCHRIPDKYGGGHDRQHYTTS
jgi:hypothetical protein